MICNKFSLNIKQVLFLARTFLDWVLLMFVGG